MRTLLILCIFSVCSVKAADSLSARRTFMEVRCGVIPFLKAWGTRTIKEEAKGKLSETFNLGMGKRFGHFCLGFHLDYTKYNLEGAPMIAGYYLYKSQVFNSYLIRQNLSYFSLSGGVSLNYLLKIRRFSLSFGPSVYFVCYRSPMRIENQYVGEQPSYPNIYSLPATGDAFTRDTHNWTRDNIPYFGFNVSIGRDLGHGLKLGLFASFFYDLDLKIMSGANYMDRTLLPQEGMYDLDNQYWINTGLSLRYTHR